MLDTTALLVVLTLGSTAAYHLGARATITAWLHSRYPGWLSSYMNCAACSGTLYGALIAVGFVAYGTVDPTVPAWGAILVGGAAGQVLTPMAAALHEYALQYLNGPVTDAPYHPAVVGSAGHDSDPQAYAKQDGGGGEHVDGGGI